MPASDPIEKLELVLLARGFCGASAFVPYSETKPSLHPESVLEFKINEGEARELVRRWYGERGRAPAEFGEKALTDTVRGLYIPYWTFDATASVRWTSTDGSADPIPRQENLAGGEARFDDILVPASQGLNHASLAGLEPFPTQEAKSYHPGFVAGWVVERYQLDLANAAVVGRQQMERELRRHFGRQPGQTIPANLRCEMIFSQETFKLTLVPVWVFNYLFRGEPYQVLVNGYTKQITGSYLSKGAKSFVTAGIVIVAALLLIWCLFHFSSRTS